MVENSALIGHLYHSLYLQGSGTIVKEADGKAVKSRSRILQQNSICQMGQHHRIYANLPVAVIACIRPVQEQTSQNPSMDLLEPKFYH